MKARDGGGRISPQTAELRFNILRNNFSPVFINTPYSTIILSNRPVSNDIIIDVNATDNDPIYRTITYTLVGDPTSKEYFAVDPVTGYITLIKSLADTDTDVFYVSKTNYCFIRN